ncbi:MULTISPECIES: serine kinase [unclassified Mesorhizobium]|uniref:HPr kinase/phosphorylase n=1 Tax=unclassified Mesorhizobium TaxID=325217 RepID=UPI000F75546E|nr:MULTISPECIES: serine kinase [unclassified Mesorhizobium]TGT60836.1 serine kinase [Mesorhizobium sp. M00.F.Ca.ET.170.01.1.1]AZO10064.1 serine kinase [Mesorhizobium sp. M3A.F.Ca.ET.080.04.2.1]RWB75750.1 MAG: serine kinase [Mesorhizobium sp.]RWB91502.1 MAG: serine kinase [Mesorhizobium sp.]RWE21261.1 MAG: serine kinase [Mesorhizobium sp.]
MTASTAALTATTAQDAARGSGQRARVRRFYKAYGLTIGSEMALPELEPTPPAAPDIVIAVGPVDVARPDAEGGFAFRFGPTRQYLSWPAVGSFMITDAARIDVDPAPGIDDPLLAFPLLGPVLALLLHQRGLLILHASAIAVGDGGVIFMGDKGAGKSTTAGAMIRTGHRLLSDDVVALDLSSPGRPMILPGFPQLKLAAEAADAIRIGQAEVRPPVHPQIEKTQHRLREGFSSAPVPAARIYILQRGERAEISQLPSAGALPAVIKFSYVTRFGRLALGGDLASTHLHHCAQLAGTIGIRRLGVPTGLERLEEAVALIESDVAAGARKG